MLEGCAHTQKMDTGPVQTVAIPAYIPTEINVNNQGLLEFMGNFIQLPAELQKKELAQINLALAQNKDDINNRMKAAMIYGFSSSRMREASKAQTLLDDLLREKSLDSERKTLAILLRDHLSENGKLSQRFRDEQKRADNLQAKLDNLQQRTDNLTQKLEETQKRAEQLQKKLDDLKEIEKTMLDRDKGVR